MSTFFGIVHRDKQTLQLSNLQQMRDSYKKWQCSSVALWHQGTAGFGVRLRPVTAEDANEVLPLETESFVLSGHFFLTNRTELCQKLAINNSDKLPDSQLVVQLWQRYAEQTVQFLDGDWAFALWHKQQQRLTLARSATGSAGIFYHINQHAVYFGSSVKDVLSQGDVSHALDDAALARVALFNPGLAADEQTAYSAIKQLNRGYLLQLTQTEQQLQRWWRPERLQKLKFNHAEQAFTAFRSLYQQQVAACIRTSQAQVAATLSGGLDSGSVVALAMPVIRAQGKKLTAYTHVPAYNQSLYIDRALGDEKDTASATARHAAVDEHICVTSNDKSVFDGMLLDLEICDMPCHAAANLYWMHDIFQRAVHSGNNLCLVGYCGNATVSFAGNRNLWPLLFKADWRRAYRIFITTQRKSGLVSCIKRHLLSPLKMFKNPFFDYQKSVLEVLTQAQQKRFWPKRFSLASARAEQQFRLLSIRNHADFRNHLYAEYFGITTADPTATKAMVEFCYQLPEEYFYYKGVNKSLIKTALKDCLPEFVLQQKLKGLQSSDVDQRLAAECAQQPDYQFSSATLNTSWFNSSAIASEHFSLDGEVSTFGRLWQLNQFLQSVDNAPR